MHNAQFSGHFPVSLPSLCCAGYIGRAPSVLWEILIIKLQCHQIWAETDDNLCVQDRRNLKSAPAMHTHCGRILLSSWGFAFLVCKGTHSLPPSFGSIAPENRQLPIFWVAEKCSTKNEFSNEITTFGVYTVISCTPVFRSFLFV